MTIYLRNINNRTVVDIELTNPQNDIDIHVAINIETYSKLLLNFLHRADEVIKDFQGISELRRWFWEVYNEQIDNPNIKELKKEIDSILISIAEKYSLNYVID